MSLYTGIGFYCRQSAGCGFRVQPSSGDDRDMNECAKILKDHEARCRWELVVPDKPFDRSAASIDDRRTALAMRALDIEEPGWKDPDQRIAADRVAFNRTYVKIGKIIPAPAPRDRTLAPRSFNVRCQVCEEMFVAGGPRASYCPKETCQKKRLVKVA